MKPQECWQDSNEYPASSGRAQGRLPSGPEARCAGQRNDQEEVELAQGDVLAAPHRWERIAQNLAVRCAQRPRVGSGLISMTQPSHKSMLRMNDHFGLPETYQRQPHSRHVCRDISPSTLVTVTRSF